MSKVLFVNKNPDPEALDKVTLFNGKAVTTVNEGPAGSAVIDAGGLRLGMVNFKTIPLGTGPSETGSIEAVGKLVVMVGNEVVPHYFDAIDIDKFFNEKNALGLGIQIVSKPSP